MYLIDILDAKIQGSNILALRQSVGLYKFVANIGAIP